jgi:hypothetical protein
MEGPGVGDVAPEVIHKEAAKQIGNHGRHAKPDRGSVG